MTGTAASALRAFAVVAVCTLAIACGPSAASRSADAAPDWQSIGYQCTHASPINDEGLSDAQRDALYKAASARGWQCTLAWRRSLDLATLPYRSLGQTGLLVSYAPPGEQTLSDAKLHASVVVRAVVQSLTLQPDALRLDAAVRVTEAFKGSAFGSTIEVSQASQLAPADGYQTVVIANADSAPLLLPGDEVFLFLSPGQSGLWPLGFTGTFYVRDGLVHSLDFNPFASSVNVMTPQQFEAAITAA